MLSRTLNSDTRTIVEADREPVLHFMRYSPEKYLSLAGLSIEEVIDRSDEEGSWKGKWRVMELITFLTSQSSVSEVTMSALDLRTRYTICWDRRKDGCEWRSIAPLRVRVTNTFDVGDTAYDDAGQPLTVIIETATLTCPAIVLPLVRAPFKRAHRRIHESLKQHFRQFKRDDVV